MPVETFGCLGKGEAMFITTGLPSYEVKGDEIQNYLMAVARFGAGGAGIGANETVITGVRVVCQNTLVAGMKAAVERYKIVHDENAVDRMWKWLHDAWEKAESRSRMLAEAYNVLANYKITDADQVQVLESAYPLPHKPGTDAPEQVVAGRNKLWEQGCELRLEQRQAVAELFAGAGMGMNTEAAAGTAWGLYNAAVELSDYGGRKLKRMGAAAESSLFGDRAMVKVRAFEACSRVAGVK
jgi:hypothetical protein